MQDERLGILIRNLLEVFNERDPSQAWLGNPGPVHGRCNLL